MTKPTSEDDLHGSDNTTHSANLNAKFKIGDEFLKILRDNTFNGVDKGDIIDHMAKVLELSGWIKIPNVDHNQIWLDVFPILLSGHAKEWWDNEIKDYFTMDDPNLTMEKYIRLEEGKAHKRGKVFNWQTATYGKIRVNDDLHNLSSVEAEFLAIVINDAVAPQDELQCKSQDPANHRLIRHMALPPHEQRHKFLRYEVLEYLDTDIVDFEGRLARIHRREVHRVPVFNFGGLPDLMAEGLSGRMLMEHRDEVSVNVFTSRAWRRMFDIRGPLVHELILEFFGTFRFGQAILDLDTPGTLQFQFGRARKRMS
ncbi:hypothetical protein Tco_0370513 [Tanacetum coccineum]